MPFSEMGALIRVDPEAAKKRILDALREADGNRVKAAEVMGLTHERSLYRWIQKLKLWEEVDRIGKRRFGAARKQEGENEVEDDDVEELNFSEPEDSRDGEDEDDDDDSVTLLGHLA